MDYSYHAIDKLIKIYMLGFWKEYCDCVLKTYRKEAVKVKCLGPNLYILHRYIPPPPQFCICVLGKTGTPQKLLGFPILTNANTYQFLCHCSGGKEFEGHPKKFSQLMEGDSETKKA